MPSQFSEKPSEFVHNVPSAISIRDLQKMSAGMIQALAGPTPIKSGTAIVAMLTPVRVKTPSALQLLETEAEILRWQEQRKLWTAEEEVEAQRILAARGITDA